MHYRCFHTGYSWRTRLRGIASAQYAHEVLNTITGFLVVGVAIGVGIVIGRIDLLGDQARVVLGRLTFFVLSPVLLFTVLAQADVRTLFSALLPVSAGAALIVIALSALVMRGVWRRSTGETLVGALSAGQVNANNIGIPLSLYLLGDAAVPAPVILFQLVLLTPIAMAIFEATTTGTRRPLPILSRTFANPIVIGAGAGALVAISGIRLPALVLDPLQLIADACIPILLISYGMSLSTHRFLGDRTHRRDVLLATGLKLLAMPLIAWVLATFVFRLESADVLAVTVMASLPTAQNVFVYAQRFDVGESIARDSVLLTTIGCIPVLLFVLTTGG